MNIFTKIMLLVLFKSILCGYSPKAGSFIITRIHYSGGGDWYADPSSLSNLLLYVDKNTNIEVNKIENRAKIGSDDFYKSFYLYMTGHGNVKFSNNEVIILRNFLLDGGFLHADDNYGMDESFRREMKKVFPDKDWVELPPDHSIFNIFYKFDNGLPKVHEHNKKRPQALALFHNNDIIALYTYESDLGDGWEDVSVHNNPEALRLEALKMGTNIILHSLSR